MSQVLNVVLISIPFSGFNGYSLFARLDFMFTHHGATTRKRLNVKGQNGSEIHFDEKKVG